MKIIDNLYNKPILGIETGLSNKATLGTEFTDIRKSSGFILSHDDIETFNLPEITEVNGNVVVYTNNFARSLTKLVNENIKIEEVLQIIETYLILQKNSIKLPQFSTNLLFKDSTNKTIILPPEIISYLSNKESLKERLKNNSIYNHPNLNGIHSILYSIGILLFISTTDSYPIVFSDVEDLRDKMRRGKLLKPRWKNIKISSELNNLIEKLLTTDTNITLDQTYSNLKTIIDSGIFRKDENYLEEEKQNKIKENLFLKRENIRHFVNKHSGILIGSTIAFIFLLLFLGTIISNSLKPPSTVGFTQEQVLETYFEGFQTINPELLDDTLKNGVRNNDSEEISAIYVTSKMKMQYDSSLAYLTPQKWLELSDDKKFNSDVYGINNLKYETIGPNTYRVNYEKWFTEAVDKDSVDTNPEIGVFKIEKEEIFTLEETKFSYIIINIETISEKSEHVW